MISFVVAVAQNGVIGKDQSLAWHLPGDLKRFKEITLTGSKTMIMGRKTFEALPRVLPGRKHIVLTRNKYYKISDEHVQVIHSINEVLPYVDIKDEFFVIGGAQIFDLLFPYAGRMYITEIHQNFEGDTYFPNYDNSEWIVKERQEGITDHQNPYRHTFLILERK